jgi:hypothetical protein
VLPVAAIAAGILSWPMDGEHGLRWGCKRGGVPSLHVETWRLNTEFGEGVRMSVGWFQGRRLQFNDTVVYRAAVPSVVNPHASVQSADAGPYVGKLVDFTDAALGVRADGWMGEAPLYYVSLADVLSVAGGGS